MGLLARVTPQSFRQPDYIGAQEASFIQSRPVDSATDSRQNIANFSAVTDRAASQDHAVGNAE